MHCAVYLIDNIISMSIVEKMRYQILYLPS